jgi:hypothetical protein
MKCVAIAASLFAIVAAALLIFLAYSCWEIYQAFHTSPFFHGGEYTSEALINSALLFIGGPLFGVVAPALFARWAWKRAH